MPAVNLFTDLPGVYKCVHILVGRSPNKFFPQTDSYNVVWSLKGRGGCMGACACATGGYESILELEAWVQILFLPLAYCIWLKFSTYEVGLITVITVWYYWTRRK